MDEQLYINSILRACVIELDDIQVRQSRDSFHVPD